MISDGHLDRDPAGRLGTQLAGLATNSGSIPGLQDDRAGDIVAPRLVGKKDSAFAGHEAMIAARAARTQQFTATDAPAAYADFDAGKVLS